MAPRCPCRTRGNWHAPIRPQSTRGGHGRILLLLVLHEVHSGLALHPRWGPMYGPADRNFGVFSIAWEAHRRQLGVVVRLTKQRAWKLRGGPIAGALELPMNWQPSRHDKPQGTPWPEGVALPGLPAPGLGPRRIVPSEENLITLGRSPPPLRGRFAGQFCGAG